MFEPVENAPVDNYAEDNRKFFFEIFEKGKLVARGNKILNTLSWGNELMYVPTTSLFCQSLIVNILKVEKK